MAENNAYDLPKHILSKIDKQVSEFKEIKSKESWYIQNPSSLKSLVNTYRLHLEMDAIKKYNIEQKVNNRAKRIR
jgi:hypothetical protein